MPAVITRAEYGTLDVVGAFPSIPLNTPAWDAESYFELYLPPEQVGEDRPIPGVTGRLAMPREWDEGIAGIPLVVYGTHDYQGVAYADARLGLRTNLRFLRDNVFKPPGTADGTRPFTFHELGGAAYTEDVIVQMGAASAKTSFARLTVRLIVPAGVIA